MKRIVVLMALCIVFVGCSLVSVSEVTTIKDVLVSVSSKESNTIVVEVQLIGTSGFLIPSENLETVILCEDSFNCFSNLQSSYIVSKDLITLTFEELPITFRAGVYDANNDLWIYSGPVTLTKN